MLLMVAALPMLFTACEDDNDSNPTLTVPESFVLNRPEFAANNVYDLPSSQYVNFTTTQPNYGGWPAAVGYAVQLSLDDTDAEGWRELSTTYTSTKINVKAEEINLALLDMYRAAHDDADPEGEMDIFVRLRAFLPDSGNDFGEVYSNAVTIRVLCYDTPSDATLPTAVYVCGNSIADAWSTWKPLAPVYGKDGRFYTLIYNNADGFKWGYKENDWFGYDLIDEIDNQVDGLTITAASDGNIVFDKAGWYTLEFITKIVGSNVQVKLVVAPGAAGVRGAVAGGDWDNDHLFTPGADKDSNWTYTAEGAGEMRAYIVVPGEDWWRTEFTFFGGELYWRTVDIPGNWASDVGDDYSVQVATGQTVSINFDRNTGSVQ